jgi:hypothetical protein
LSGAARSAGVGAAEDLNARGFLKVTRNIGPGFAK